MSRKTIDYSAPTADPTNPYRSPDPRTVAIIIDGYGLHAALERWSSVPATSISKLGIRGRQLIRPAA